MISLSYYFCHTRRIVSYLMHAHTFLLFLSSVNLFPLYASAFSAKKTFISLKKFAKVNSIITLPHTRTLFGSEVREMRSNATWRSVTFYISQSSPKHYHNKLFKSTTLVSRSRSSRLCFLFFRRR